MGRTLKGHKSPPIQFVSIEAVFQEKLLVILWQDQYFEILWQDQYFEMPKATLQSTHRQDEIEQQCYLGSRGFKLRKYLPRAEWYQQQIL